MSRLKAIADIVNREVPNFSKPLYTPAEMLREQAADCFGRAILTYALLRGADVPDEALSLLVDTIHGSERGLNKYWQGHTMLLVETEPDGGLIDSQGMVFIRSLRDVTWPSSSTSQDVCLVGSIDYAVHRSVEQGMLDYQLSHPALAERERVTIDDYRSAYAGLIAMQALDIQ